MPGWMRAAVNDPADPFGQILRRHKMEIFEHCPPHMILRCLRCKPDKPASATASGPRTGCRFVEFESLAVLPNNQRAGPLGESIRKFAREHKQNCPAQQATSLPSAALVRRTPLRPSLFGGNAAPPTETEATDGTRDCAAATVPSATQAIAGLVTFIRHRHAVRTQAEAAQVESLLLMIVSQEGLPRPMPRPRLTLSTPALPQVTEREESVFGERSVVNPQRSSVMEMRLSMSAVDATDLLAGEDSALPSNSGFTPDVRTPSMYANFQRRGPRGRGSVIATPEDLIGLNTPSDAPSALPVALSSVASAALPEAAPAAAGTSAAHAAAGTSAAHAAAGTSAAHAAGTSAAHAAAGTSAAHAAAGTSAAHALPATPATPSELKITDYYRALSIDSIAASATSSAPSHEELLASLE